MSCKHGTSSGHPQGYPRNEACAGHRSSSVQFTQVMLVPLVQSVLGRVQCELRERGCILLAVWSLDAWAEHNHRRVRVKSLKQRASPGQVEGNTAEISTLRMITQSIRKVLKSVKCFERAEIRWENKGFFDERAREESSEETVVT